MMGDTDQANCACDCWGKSGVAQTVMRAKQQRMRERVGARPGVNRSKWRGTAEAAWTKAIEDAGRALEVRLTRRLTAKDKLPWTFSVEFELPDGRIKVAELCEATWLEFFNFKQKRQFESDKSKVKKLLICDRDMAEIVGKAVTKKLCKDALKQGVLHNPDGTPMTIYEAREAMADTISLTEEQLQLLVVGTSPMQREAYYFMKKLFNLIADKAPNRESGRRRQSTILF